MLKLFMISSAIQPTFGIKATSKEAALEKFRVGFDGDSSEFTEHPSFKVTEIYDIGQLMELLPVEFQVSLDLDF